MWFGRYDNKVTPSRAAVLQDIIIALVILAIATAVVWYMVTQQVSAAALVANEETLNPQQTLPEAVSAPSQQLMVIYIAHPCEGCQELLASFQSDAGTALSPVYRPVSLATAVSEEAAQALFCAHEQNAMEDYYAALSTESHTEHGQMLRDVAVQIELDQDRFATCLDHEQTAQAVTAYTEMMHQHGVTSPPVIEVVSVFTGTIDPATITQALTNGSR